MWERQAYLKLRPVAGDLDLALPFIESLSGLIYHVTPADRLAEEMSVMRRRMQVELTKEKVGKLHVKLGRGGMADIEFAVQLLQLAHGAERPALRGGNTLKVLEAAGHEGLLAEEEVACLRAAYRFLRAVQNRLRVASDLGNSSLPEEASRRDRLARRLGYEAEEGRAPGERLLADYLRYTEQVRTIYDATFGRYSRGERKDGEPRTMNL